MLRNGLAARAVRATAVLFALASLAACSDDGDPTGLDTTAQLALQAVSPANGVTGVSTATTVTLQFSHVLATGMEAYLDVHEGTVAGPVVAGTWSRSADGRTLAFTANPAFKPRTTYVIHLGGGLRAQDGRPLDHASCTGLGGRSVTGGMMGAGGGGMMHGGGPMTGSRWQGSDGNYGMLFTFTTA